MNYLLMGYTIFYLFFSLGGVYSSFKANYSLWIIFADLLSSLIGIAGLLLYQLHFKSPELQAQWLIAFAVLLSCSLFVAAIDLYDEWSEEETSINSLALVTSLTILTELPCFYINLLYAMGKF